MKSTRTKTTTFRKKGKHITDSERQIIEKLYRKGVPIPQIAALLEVHRSTIYRELQRGRVTHLNSELITFSTYSADRAIDDAFSRLNKLHGSYVGKGKHKRMEGDSHFYMKFGAEKKKRVALRLLANQKEKYYVLQTVLRRMGLSLSKVQEVRTD